MRRLTAILLLLGVIPRGEAHVEDAAKPAKSKHRRWQFTLRTMLVAITIVCVALAGIAALEPLQALFVTFVIVVLAFYIPLVVAVAYCTHLLVRSISCAVHWLHQRVT